MHTSALQASSDPRLLMLRVVGLDACSIAAKAPAAAAAA